MNQVVVADPLHVWLLEYWDALRADLVSDNHMREGLADAARVIRAMEPVLESGAVLTTPLLDEPYERNQHFVDEGVLAATDPGFASAVAGSNMAFDPEQLPDEDYDVDAAAIGQMLAGRMEQAYASHARFAPLEPIDWAFLDYWLRRGSDVARQHILHEQQFQMRMINALTLIDLPTFSEP